MELDCRYSDYQCTCRCIISPLIRWMEMEWPLSQRERERRRISNDPTGLSDTRELGAAQPGVETPPQ